jgi:hypothetical protein
MSTATSTVRGPGFATTQWSIVLSAGRADDTASRQALEDLWTRTENYPATLEEYEKFLSKPGGTLISE